MSNKYLEYLRKFLHKYLSTRVILAFSLFWGHFAYFNGTQIFSFFTKLYCFTILFILPAILFLFPHFPILILLEAFVSVSLSFAEAGGFSRFSASLERIDGFPAICHLSDLTYLVLFFIVILRFFLHITVRVLFDPPAVFSSIYFILYRILDFGHVKRILIFDMLYVRTKLMRTSFQNTFIDVTDDPVITENTICQIKKYMRAYKQLQDSFQFLGEFQASLFTVLLVRFGVASITIHMILTNKFENPPSVVVFGTLHDVIYAVILECSPILFIELASNEVEKITTILEQQLQRYTDSRLLRELETAIRYLMLRPFRFCIWRVFEVDTTLLLSYASLTFTYIIFILQLHAFI